MRTNTPTIIMTITIMTSTIMSMTMVRKKIWNEPLLELMQII